MANSPAPIPLFLALDTLNGTLKAGTCPHCVVEEPLGRPERAWDIAGDQELDFDRDTLISKLAARGLRVTLKEEYICP